MNKEIKNKLKIKKYTKKNICNHCDIIELCKNSSFLVEKLNKIEAKYDQRTTWNRRNSWYNNGSN